MSNKSYSISKGDVYEREVLGASVKLEVSWFTKDSDIVFKIQCTKIEIVMTDTELEQAERDGSMRFVSKG